MAGFYEGLRDGVVKRLLKKFGRNATLAIDTSTYTPSTGIAVPVDDEVAVRIVTLPMKSPRPGNPSARDLFSEEQVESFDQMVIMGAHELLAKGVAPGTDDKLVIGADEARIVAIAPISPAGIDVCYIMGIARV